MPASIKSAVLVVAHGSRSERSNRHFAGLVEELRRRVDIPVAHAFLEMAEPGIGAGLDSLRERGAARISLLPYFLSPGRHVVEDIPKIVNAYTNAHPDIAVTLTPFFGSLFELVIPAMVNLIADVATRPETPG